MAATKSQEIVEAEIRKCRVPLANSYKLSDKLGTLETTEPIYLRLSTDAGVTGVGETIAMIPFTENSPDAIIAILKEHLPHILSNIDPTNPNQLHEHLATVLGEGNQLTKAAIDMACYDLYGKIVEQPVYELLGGRLRTSIPILKPLGNDSPKANAEQARAEVQQGFRSLMLKAGQYSIATDLERLSTLRNQVGDEVNIVVDANQGWDTTEAIEFVSEAQQYNVTFLEQPVPAQNISGMKRIREQSRLPISADEGLFSTYDARRLLKNDAIDVFSLKVAKHGGITPSRNLMRLADAYDKKYFMNSMIETGVAQAASLHVGVTGSSLVEMGHAYMSPLRLDASLTNYTEKVVQEAQAVVPDTPGLGIEIDEEALEAHTVQTTRIEV